LCADLSIDELVDRLGHAKFHERIAAERELLERGVSSVGAVLEGVESEDPEIRLRSERLLRQLQVGMFAERADEIQRNPWIMEPSYRPGWEFYHSLAGDGPAARKLYMMMLREETELMMSFLGKEDRRTQKFQRRLSDLRAFYQRRVNKSVTPGTVAALLLVALSPEARPPRDSITMLNSLLSQTNFWNAVTGSDIGAPLQSLVGVWVSTDRYLPAQSRLSLAGRLQIIDGINPAREMIQLRPANARGQLQNAILYIAKFGEASAILELEALLEDEEILWPTLRRTATTTQKIPPQNIQVRDVALLGLLTITEQDVVPYQFRRLNKDVRYIYTMHSGGFDSEEKRKAAFSRWYQWRAKNLGRPTGDVLDASEGTSL